MTSQMSYVMTLANSIIGVSVLAMPFCFKQCGIVLATLILLLSSILSRLACHFLIKSAVMSRRRNFELLAFHAFGQMGKFLVELFIIGFLVGTCIAFFVVMGDLGPQIVGKMIKKNPEDIRTSLLITTSIFIVLPLGLLRNIDSLSSLCTATIIFYVCLVLKIITESMQHIFAGDWYEHVYYWKPSGTLQCIPIFSMALFCQTQLFEIYETIPNVSLEKMNEVVRGALNICTIVYLCVGFFGYIAFCTQSFTGNILMSLEPSLSSEMIKMGFVFSIAFSFPLVIFPCRASLNSLLFRRVYTHEASTNYMPETRFRCLTITIVAVSLITGILIPNIEFVLGLVGSTIGVMICLIFPAIFFISISSKHTNERLLAQVILFIGICIMILGTYANLYALEESGNIKVSTPANRLHNQVNNLPSNLKKGDINSKANVPMNDQVLPNDKERIDNVADINDIDKRLNSKANDIRQEPPIPVERIAVTEKPSAETQKSVNNILVTISPLLKRLVEEKKSADESLPEQAKNLAKNDLAATIQPNVKKSVQENPIKVGEGFLDRQKNDNLINSDAIKKEESELAADAEATNMLAAERHEKLRQTLEKHKREQLQMMEEQKEILKDLKEQKQEIERQKQRIVKDTQALEESNARLKDRNESTLPRLGNYDAQFSGKLKEDSSNKTLLHKSFYSVQSVNNKKTLDSKLNVGENRRIGTGTNNSQELFKGPILNALMRRSSQKSKNVHDVKSEIARRNDSAVIAPILQTKLDSKFEVAQHENPVPIALRIRNQSYAENAIVAVENNKTEENVQVLRRDILEEHERKRRDVDVQIGQTDAKAANASHASSSTRTNDQIMKNVAVNDDVGRNEKCMKQVQHTEDGVTGILKKEFEPDTYKGSILDASLIKTNVYLSDQEFANTVAVNPNIPIREYVQLKQRDLKSVAVGEDYSS